MRPLAMLGQFDHRALTRHGLLENDIPILRNTLFRLTCRYQNQRCQSQYCRNSFHMGLFGEMLCY